MHFGHLAGKRELIDLLLPCLLCIHCNASFFSCPLGAIDKACFVIVAFPNLHL